MLEARRVRRFAGLVAAGKRIYIPHTPRTELRDTVELATRLRKETMEPVPHVAARRIENFAALDDFLARLSGEAGVSQVLIVAGDAAKPSGVLGSALEILESGVLEKHGIRTVGVAGHPEGHPDIGEAVLRDALRRKNLYAQKTRTSVYIVTQFTFSAGPVIAWEVSHAGDIGLLPITVGLPGLATARTLLKYAVECGIGASLKAFSKRYDSLTKLLTIARPDETIVDLARYKEQTPQSRIAGVHFFTFGGFERTAAWANQIASGNFEVTEGGKLMLI
ncbi:MAG: hypothetical protein AUI91_06590 [Acidobacteria bacterium 13_1_40CM_3_56_11]|nr:MAG: hypothetical protein AUI91_06590 [Acidobacteria bacterium 13_1_40CM_3_56_11]